MAINIKDPDTDRLARELAALTGEPLTAAVREAIVERLAVVRRRKAGDRGGDKRRCKRDLKQADHGQSCVDTDTAPVSTPRNGAFFFVFAIPPW